MECSILKEETDSLPLASKSLPMVGQLYPRHAAGKLAITTSCLPFLISMSMSFARISLPPADELRRRWPSPDLRPTLYTPMKSPPFIHFNPQALISLSTPAPLLLAFAVDVRLHLTCPELKLDSDLNSSFGICVSVSLDAAGGFDEPLKLHVPKPETARKSVDTRELGLTL